MQNLRNSCGLFLILCLSIVGSGCKPGVEYADLPLVPEDFIDYGEKIENRLERARSSAYASMQRRAETDGISQMNSHLVYIAAKLKELKKLPESYPAGTFDQVQEEHIALFVNELEQKIATEITPKIFGVDKSLSSLESLQRSLEDLLRTNAYLLTRVARLKNLIPKNAHSEYETRIAALKLGFAKIYQLVILYPYERAHQKSYELVSGLKSSLDKLKLLEEKNAIFDNPESAKDAKAALSSAFIHLEEMQVHVGQITSDDLVKGKLIEKTARLKESVSGLLGLQRRYVDQVSEDYRTVAQNSLLSAEKIIDELGVLFKAYDEASKSSSDDDLQKLRKEIFSKKVPTLFALTTKKDETDLIRFMRVLSQSRVLGLRADAGSESFVQALSAALHTRGIAEFYGLYSDALYALNHVKLNATKTSFGMDNQAFATYVKSIATKGYEKTSRKGQLSAIYVIFADRLAPGVDIQELIKIFSQQKSRVILVANRPTDYKVNASFELSGLDLYSSIEVARAILQNLDPSLIDDNVHEIVAKSMFAFKKSSNRLNLLSVENLVKDVALRLANKPRPTEQEILGEVQNALMANSEDFEHAYLTSSKLVADSVERVIANVEKDPSFYVREMKNFIGSFDKSKSRTIEQIAKFEKSTTDNAELNKIHLKIKEARAQLALISNGFDLSSPDAVPRKLLIEEIGSLLNIYAKIITKLYDLTEADLKAFLKGPKNDFRTFFEKMITIVTNPQYLSGLKDPNATQSSLYKNSLSYLPREILSMLDAYSAWHPAAYFGAALGNAFDTRFKGHLPSIQEVQDFYDRRQSRKLYRSPTTVLKAAIVEETKELVKLADRDYSWARSAKNAVRKKYLEMAIAERLKYPRFIKESIAKDLLSTQIKEVKILIPLWPELLDLTRDIEQHSEQIFMQLTKIRKK